MLKLLVLVGLVGVAFGAPEEKYTTKYDNVNLDEILNNQRLYSKYLECLKTGQKCTPDGKLLKGKSNFKLSFLNKTKN
jgi:hypothetical protein